MNLPRNSMEQTYPELAALLSVTLDRFEYIERTIDHQVDITHPDDHDCSYYFFDSQMVFFLDEDPGSEIDRIITNCREPLNHIQSAEHRSGSCTLPFEYDYNKVAHLLFDEKLGTYYQPSTFFPQLQSPQVEEFVRLHLMVEILQRCCIIDPAIIGRILTCGKQLSLPVALLNHVMVHCQSLPTEDQISAIIATSSHTIQAFPALSHLITLLDGSEFTESVPELQAAVHPILNLHAISADHDFVGILRKDAFLSSSYHENKGGLFTTPVFAAYHVFLSRMLEVGWLSLQDLRQLIVHCSNIWLGLAIAQLVDKRDVLPWMNWIRPQLHPRFEYLWFYQLGTVLEIADHQLRLEYLIYRLKHYHLFDAQIRKYRPTTPEVFADPPVDILKTVFEPITDIDELFSFYDYLQVHMHDYTLTIPPHSLYQVMYHMYLNHLSEQGDRFMGQARLHDAGLLAYCK